MFPAVLHFTHSEAQYGKSEVALSRFSSCIMLVAYASYLFFQLKSHRSMYSPIGDVSSLTLSFQTLETGKKSMHKDMNSLTALKNLGHFSSSLCNKMIIFVGDYALLEVWIRLM
jgi:Ca2+/H+ antiporter